MDWKREALVCESREEGRWPLPSAWSEEEDSSLATKQSKVTGKPKHTIMYSVLIPHSSSPSTDITECSSTRLKSHETVACHIAH